MPMSILGSGATHPSNSPSENISAQLRLEKRPSAPLLYGRKLHFLFLLWCGLYVIPFPVHSQILQEETLSGPDSHETVKAGTGISSETGAASGRACSSAACDSISNT
jgi:hypothetical protein